MREIKHRGRSIDNKRWVYGYYLHKTNDFNEDAHCILSGQFSDTGDGTGNEYPEIEYVDPETIGEYIGLDDMHDNPIFTGDITTGVYGNQVVTFGKIGYESSWCGVTGFALEDQYDSSEDCYELARNVNLECEEIIGNIFDNADLL